MIRECIQSSVRLVPFRARTWVHQIPLVASLQRWILANTIQGREFNHVIDAGPGKGLVYPVLLPDDKNVWTGSYEVNFVSALVDAIQPGDICFDIGGWHGYCGGVMSKRGARCVYIFEPLPENCRRIERLIELNPDLSIYLLPQAVGESCGTASFSVHDASSMGKLATSPFQTDVEASRVVSVEMTTIDQWREKESIELPDMMKVDVEGAELMVLKGAENTLRLAHPKLFVECHSSDLRREVTRFLERLGYNCVVLEEAGVGTKQTGSEVVHLICNHANKS